MHKYLLYIQMVLATKSSDTHFTMPLVGNQGALQSLASLLSLATPPASCPYDDFVEKIELKIRIEGGGKTRMAYERGPNKGLVPVPPVKVPQAVLWMLIAYNILSFLLSLFLFFLWLAPVGCRSYYPDSVSSVGCDEESCVVISCPQHTHFGFKALTSSQSLPRESVFETTEDGSRARKRPPPAWAGVSGGEDKEVGS